MQGAYQAAINAYLDIAPSAAHDPQKLAPAWQTAVRLASQHLPAQVPDIATRAAQNLAAAKLPEAGAALLLSVGDKQGALKVFCQAGLMAKAHAMAAGDQLLEDFIAELVAAGIGRSASPGGGSSASVAELDDLARRGNWAQVQRHPPLTPPGNLMLGNV
jgi:hypothetical protein